VLPGAQAKEGFMNPKFSLSQFVPTLVAMVALCPAVASADPVNINTASASELDKALNGVGPARAKAIVDYREKNGPFKSADQLALVDGISQAVIDKNRADIRVGNEGAKSDAKAAPAKAAQ
jgi:competence protein ComEA